MTGIFVASLCGGLLLTGRTRIASAIGAACLVTGGWYVAQLVGAVVFRLFTT